MEAKHYYDGLPSRPPLVVRSNSAPWEAPTVPEENRPLEELHPMGKHPIKDVWEEGVAPKLFDLLKSMSVEWTSIDLVRIGKSSTTLRSTAHLPSSG
ncbi:hypothetical protein MVEN_00363900 [Mycena venus]|uniref:Uncharacterized protein n=1 Tax=Mycena venus TaxID=2733690 RepID=A0A8H7DAJ2_9AGAR|nr:hypothetical protein MVEN_00363900 [Mycena venus]